MSSDSGNYWNTLDTDNGDKEVSTLSRHLLLEANSVGTSPSQKQLFRIFDFSPQWAFSGVETKVNLSDLIEWSIFLLVTLKSHEAILY